jgi:hypothetical protein
MQAIRTGMVLLIAALGPWALDSAIPAQERPSIAEAARRAREQRQNQPKSKQVWTNDNIPATPGAISVVGKALEPTAAPEAAAASAAESKENNQKTEAGPEGKPANAAPAAEADKKAEEQAAAESELAKAKEHLASLRTDLDLLQRE